MEITKHSYQQPSFKGFDARTLETLVLRRGLCAVPDDFVKIGGELQEIGDKYGFNVVIQHAKGFLKNFKQSVQDFESNTSTWAQDNLIALKNKVFTKSPEKEAGEAIGKFLNKTVDGEMPTDFKSGNFFITKFGKDESIILGADDVKYTDFIQNKMGLSKIHKISQPDFHIDLAIRPLDNKRVLVADDSLTVEYLQKAVENSDKYLKEHKFDLGVRLTKSKLSNRLKDFQKQIAQNGYASSEKTIAELTEQGFTPIRVPGRIYNAFEPQELYHDMNYMNAIVHKTADGKLVYITNKSTMNKSLGISEEKAKKIGFDFESMFKESIKPYVNEEDVYFVSGGNNLVSKLLRRNKGGVHCLSAEVPKFE